jgi:hypothetical protein
VKKLKDIHVLKECGNEDPGLVQKFYHCFHIALTALYTAFIVSRDSLPGIATGCGEEGRGFGIKFPAAKTGLTPPPQI